MNQASDFSPAEGNLSVKVIGVGDAGCRAADLLAEEALPGVEFFALNSDVRGLQDIQTAGKVQLGRDLLRGLSAGGDPELGRASAEADHDRLNQHFVDTDLVILLGGLGGGTGSGALPVVARQARETGALVLSFVSLPFDFEGQQRRQRADLGLNQLLVSSDAVISLPNQTFLEIVDERTRLPETFEIINRAFLQGVRGIWQMIEKSGLINVSFQDLRSVVQSKHAKSSFAVAEAQGENRSREVVEALLAHPLLSGDDQLEDADALLVNIVGGETLSISEVDRIMERLRRHVGDTRIVVGASTDPSMGEKVGLTLISSWHRKTRSVSLKIDSPQAEEFTFPVPIEGAEIETSFFKRSTEVTSTSSRYAAPPPESEDRRADLFFSQSQTSFTQRRRIKRQLKQGMLKLEAVSRGRFEKSAPTIYNGEDLDVPTFVRRCVALN
ncbi:cell division FtsZ family protein [bacterium]|nr:cell division FtsZ family protein [bacterium]MDB4796683.1 cell division FtsZ family protein [bacterium]